MTPIPKPISTSLLQPKARWILIFLIILYISLFIFFIVIYQPLHWDISRGKEDASSNTIASTSPIESGQLIAGTNITLPKTEQPDYEEDPDEGTSGDAGHTGEQRPLIANVPKFEHLDAASRPTFAMENNLSDADYETTRQDTSKDAASSSFYMSNWDLYEKERLLPSTNEVHLSRHIWRRGLYGVHLENADERCLVPIGLWEDGDLLKQYVKTNCERNYADADTQIPEDEYRAVSYFSSDDSSPHVSTHRNSFTHLQHSDTAHPLLWVHPHCQPFNLQQLSQEEIEEYNMHLRRLCRDVILNSESAEDNSVSVLSSPPTLSLNRTFEGSGDSTHSLTPEQRSSHCPIVYLLRGEFTQTPHFDGFYVNHIPVRLDDAEQQIFVACGGSVIWNVNTDTTATGEPHTEHLEALDTEIIIPRYSNSLVRVSHTLPDDERKRTDEPIVPTAAHAESLSSAALDELPSSPLDNPSGTNTNTQTAASSNPQQSSVPTEQPSNIFVILLQGLSRVHFHRRMLNTIDFLQHSLQDYGYRGFEFFKYLAVDQSPNSNLTPIFSGEDWRKYCTKKDNSDQCGTTSSVPIKKLVWNQLLKNNYKTCIASEVSWVDTMADWRTDTSGWTNVFSFPMDSLQRTLTNNAPLCVAGRKSYDHIFDYAAQFFQRHRKSPKFILTQFLQAQDMNVIADMDVALMQFIKGILAQTQERSYIVLLSDDGSPMERNAFFEERPTGKLEQKMPLLMVLALPGMEQKEFDNLNHNQQRLVTGYDIYETLLGMAGLPNSRKRSDILFDAPKSLFHGKLNENRDCASVQIPQDMCICNIDATA